MLLRYLNIIFPNFPKPTKIRYITEISTHHFIRLPSTHAKARYGRYIYGEIARMTHAGPEAISQLEDYLMKKLQKDDARVPLLPRVPR